MYKIYPKSAPRTSLRYPYETPSFNVKCPIGFHAQSGHCLQWRWHGRRICERFIIYEVAETPRSALIRYWRVSISPVRWSNTVVRRAARWMSGLSNRRDEKWATRCRSSIFIAPSRRVAPPMHSAANFRMFKQAYEDVRVRVGEFHAGERY